MTPRVSRRNLISELEERLTANDAGSGHNGSTREEWRSYLRGRGAASGARADAAEESAADEDPSKVRSSGAASSEAAQHAHWQARPTSRPLRARRGTTAPRAAPCVGPRRAQARPRSPPLPAPARGAGDAARSAARPRRCVRRPSRTSRTVRAAPRLH